MKTVHTAPLELLSPKPNGRFTTEPYEAGWADEALGMIYVREIAGTAPKLALHAQISADGVRWIDHAAGTLQIEKPGSYCVTLERFGNWLRVEGEVSGGPADGVPAFVIDFYWVLKG